MTPRFVLFVLRRAAASVALVFAVASTAQLLARLSPGDHLSEFEMSREQLAAIRHAEGRDRAVLEQYVDWVAGAVRMDLGQSARYQGRSVAGLIGERLGNSLRLGVLALVLATALGIPLGVLAGRERHRPSLLAARAVNIILLSLPPVVLSLALMFLAARTGWFPIG